MPDPMELCTKDSGTVLNLIILVKICTHLNLRKIFPTHHLKQFIAEPTL